MDKLIITVACDSRTSYPHNPLCPVQEDIPGVAQQYVDAVNAGAAIINVARDHMVQAIADYLPSRDVKMLEYMELLAVFEASNRKMLPKKYATMSADELQARLEILRLECGHRR